LTSTSTPYFLKNPCSLATKATRPEKTGGTPGTANESRSAAAVSELLHSSVSRPLKSHGSTGVLKHSSSLDQRVGVLPDGLVDQASVAHGVLAGFDPADFLLDRDDALKIRLCQPVVPHGPKLHLVQPCHRVFGQGLRPSGCRRYLRDPIGVLGVEHEASGIDQSGQRPDVCVALLLEPIGGANDDQVVAQG